MIAEEKAVQEPFWEELEITALNFFVSLLEHEDIIENLAKDKISEDKALDYVFEKVRNLPDEESAKQYYIKLLKIPSEIRKATIFGAYKDAMDFLESVTKVRFYLNSVEEQLDLINNNTVVKSNCEPLLFEYRRQFNNKLAAIEQQINKTS